MTRMLMVAAGVLGCVSVVQAAEKTVKETVIPIAIWVGTNDNLFPLTPVRATRDRLNEQGHAALNKGWQT